jgi:hypothetical protein
MGCSCHEAKRFFAVPLKNVRKVGYEELIVRVSFIGLCVFQWPQPRKTSGLRVALSEDRLNAARKSHRQRLHR